MTTPLCPQGLIGLVFERLVVQKAKDLRGRAKDFATQQHKEGRDALRPGLIQACLIRPSCCRLRLPAQF